MRTGVVIPSWNGEQFLGACVQSVLDQRPPPDDVVVVDNASDDDSVRLIESLTAKAAECGCRLRLLRQRENRGFVRAANVGIRELATVGSCECLVFLNQDAALDPDWLQLVRRAFASDARVGIVGSKLLMPNRLTVQHAGGYIERPRLVGKHYGHHDPDDSPLLQVQREVDFVTAAAMAVRVETLQQIGGFQEIFSPGYYEDVDLCIRAAEGGWKILYCPDATAVHVESGSFSDRVGRMTQSHRNRLVYAVRWLADVTFREEFFRAERLYVRGALTADERRALTAAYLMALLMLDDAISARTPPTQATPHMRETLAHNLLELRREIVSLPW